MKKKCSCRTIMADRLRYQCKPLRTVYEALNREERLALL